MMPVLSCLSTALNIAGILNFYYYIIHTFQLSTTDSNYKTSTNTPLI